jgi:hypothetical protein
MKERQCLADARFEIGLGAGFYGDVGHFADHGVLLLDGLKTMP